MTGLLIGNFYNSLRDFIFHLGWGIDILFIKHIDVNGVTEESLGLNLH